jgi:hypothetical protein
MDVYVETSIIYTLLDSDVHQFVLLEGLFETIDACIAQIDTLVADAPPDQALRLLIDTTQIAIVPVAHAFKGVQSLLERYHERPVTRVAFLHSPICPVALVEAFMRNLMNERDSWSFFSDDQRAEALTWVKG